MRPRAINVREFGAKGDGSTDDSAAIQAAVDQWLASHGEPHEVRDLVMPPADYVIGAPIVAPVPTHNRVGGVIEATGSTLTLTSEDPYAFEISHHGTGKSWRGLRINGLSTVDGGIRIESGGTPTATNSMWQVVLDKCEVKNGTEHGIWIDGPFESQLYSCNVTLVSGATGNGFNLARSDTDRLISSMELIGCTARGGVNGFYADIADVSIIGGTSLQSQREGYNINNNGGKGIIGVHVEQAWYTDTGSTGAGIKIAGSGSVLASFGVASGATEFDTLIYAYATGAMVLQNAGGSDQLAKFALLNGTANGHITLLGNNKTYDVDGSYAGKVFDLSKRPLGYTITNDTTDRTFDADTVTVAELADVVATMLRDLGAA